MLNAFDGNTHLFHSVFSGYFYALSIGLELSHHWRYNKKTTSLPHGACSEKLGTRPKTFHIEPLLGQK